MNLKLSLLVWLTLGVPAWSQQPSTGPTLDPRATPLPHKYMGPFVHLPDGAIAGIEKDTCITSSDGGKTWKSQPLFAGESAGKLSVRPERALLSTRDGTLVLAFMNDKEKKWTWKDSEHDAPGATLPTYVMRSTDGGRSWQDIQKLHDDWTGAVRDMIQTSDGRIIFTTMKMLHDPGRHSVLTYSSDDDGRSWRASNLIDLGGQGHHGGVTEPTLVQLKDGRVWMLIRTNWGEFWSAWSHDGGRFWRVLEPSGIESSSAPAIVKRLASGRLALVWNRPYPEGKNSFPLSGGNGIWSEVPVSNHRGELSLAFSDDEGKTWTAPVVVAAQPGKWLAYPYLFEISPGTLWLTTMQGDVRVQLKEQDFIK